MLYYDYKITVAEGFTKEEDNEVVHKGLNAEVASLNEKQAYNVRFLILLIKNLTL